MAPRKSKQTPDDGDLASVAVNTTPSKTRKPRKSTANQSDVAVAASVDSTDAVDAVDNDKNNKDQSDAPRASSSKDVPSSAAAPPATKRSRKPRVFSAAVDVTTPLPVLPYSSENDNIILKLTFSEANVPDAYTTADGNFDFVVNNNNNDVQCMPCLPEDNVWQNTATTTTTTTFADPREEYARYLNMNTSVPPLPLGPSTNAFNMHMSGMAHQNQNPNVVNAVVNTSVNTQPIPALSGLPAVSGLPGLPGLLPGMPGIPGLLPGLAGGTAIGAVGTRLVKLLADFDEKCKNGDWPVSTSVHCYWCCHRFSTTPFGLPVQYRNDKYHVMGCYCSLECAAAHNFASRESIDERLNRYALINALSSCLGLSKSVKPAPDRVVLQMFGGPLTIEEFRDISQDATVNLSFDNNKEAGMTDVRGAGGEGVGQQQQSPEGAEKPKKRHLIINTPPMLTLTQQVEELHDSDVRSEYRFIPLDTERISRFQEKVRLRRTKPLVDFKSTLDYTMKLRITPSKVA